MEEKSPYRYSAVAIWKCFIFATLTPLGNIRMKIKMSRSMVLNLQPMNLQSSAIHYELGTWYLRGDLIFMGPCKVRNETETKRNETKQIETNRNKSKRYRSKRNETNRNETKQNETSRNERKLMIWQAIVEKIGIF